MPEPVAEDWASPGAHRPGARSGSYGWVFLQGRHPHRQGYLARGEGACKDQALSGRLIGRL
ncbi:hypothetical protein ACU4GD_05425, partial [Cupriavidus basilensis]